MEDTQNVVDVHVDAALKAAAVKDSEAFHREVEKVLLSSDDALKVVWGRLASLPVSLTAQQVHAYAASWVEDCPAVNAEWVLEYTHPETRKGETLPPIPDDLHPVCTAILCMAAHENM